MVMANWKPGSGCLLLTLWCLLPLPGNKQLSNDIVGGGLD